MRPSTIGFGLASHWSRKWRELCQLITESSKAKPKQTRNYFRHSIENHSKWKIYSRLLWFYFTTLCDWLAIRVPLSQPIGKQTKTNRALLAAFSRAWRRLPEFASTSDWFIALFPSVVIGQSNHFDFHSTTLK